MIHVDTQGASIIVYCVQTRAEGGDSFDMTAYPTRVIEIKDPAGAITIHTATTVGSAANGVLSWVTTSNFFLGQAGTWYCRPRLTLDASHIYPGDWQSFEVRL